MASFGSVLIAIYMRWQFEVGWPLTILLAFGLMMYAEGIIKELKS